MLPSAVHLENLNDLQNEMLRALSGNLSGNIALLWNRLINCAILNDMIKYE